MTELDQVQKEVINTLQDIETPASQKNIRDRIGCPKSTLSTKLRKLEQQQYVIDESGFGDNSKKYVLSENVEVETSYRFEMFHDTQMFVYLAQIFAFAVIITALIYTVNITRLTAYMLYASFLLGVLPSLILSIMQKLSSEDLYSVEVRKK